MSGDGKRSVASCYASSGWTVYLVENTKVTSLCPAGCLEPSISRDGKHVAFTSDGNIYVTDMLTTVHVSTASDGAAGNANDSYKPAISPDGTGSSSVAAPRISSITTPTSPATFS